LSGVLVPERDHEALAREGAATVAAKFDQRAQIRRLEEIYLQML
jgi:hypothetical protein